MEIAPFIPLIIFLICFVAAAVVGYIFWRIFKPKTHNSTGDQEASGEVISVKVSKKTGVACLTCLVAAMAFLVVYILIICFLFFSFRAVQTPSSIQESSEVQQINE